MLLDLVTIEQPNTASMLMQAADEVAFPLSDEVKKLISDMEETLYHIQGVGLAAPQVGKVLKIILVYIPEAAQTKRPDAKKTVPMTVFLNPSYQPIGTTMREDWEGCFSVKSKIGKVPRYTKIRFRAQTLSGEWVEFIETGFYARVLQHETDHVEGMLIINRLKPWHIQGSPDQMQSLREKELKAMQKN